MKFDITNIDDKKNEENIKDVLYEALTTGQDEGIPDLLKTLVLYYTKYIQEKDTMAGLGEAGIDMIKVVLRAAKTDSKMCKKVLTRWAESITATKAT